MDYILLTIWILYINVFRLHGVIWELPLFYQISLCFIKLLWSFVPQLPNYNHITSKDSFLSYFVLDRLSYPGDFFFAFAAVCSKFIVISISRSVPASPLYSYSILWYFQKHCKWCGASKNIVSTKWAPKQLTDQHMLNRVEAEQEFWGSAISIATNSSTTELLEIKFDCTLQVWKEKALSS